VPSWLPAVARAVLAGVAALVAAGLALLLVALVWRAGRFAELVGALQPGFVGGVILLLGCLLLLPNGALWTVAYAAGPGFTVGAGTGVSPFGVTLGPVPSFPLLAALPGDGVPAPVVRAVLLLPVLAGVLAGWVVGRRLPAASAPGRLPALPTGRIARPATCGLLAGGLVALVTAVLAVLAGGALGQGYLAAVGPSGWQVAAALAVEVAVPAAVTAALVPNPERDRAAGSPAPADPAPAAGSGAAAGPADEQDAEERDPRPGGHSGRQ